MKKLLAFVLCALLVCAMVPFAVSAAEGATVVYIKDGGTGDGSTAENAVGDWQSAYNALDLSKDCTIVVCGPLSQTALFDYGIDYTGSVTITSVYGGVDYAATAGAVFSPKAVRFILRGATTFDNISINMLGNFFLVIAQCNPITVGENVKMEFSANTNGLNFGNAFGIVGAYQGGQSNPPVESDKDVNITVLSGANILIAAYNRNFAGGMNSGKAAITVGGTAQVGCLYFCSVNQPDVSCGDVEITVKDNAVVKHLIASPDKPTSSVKSLTVNWLGGNIETANTKEAVVPGLSFTETNTTLCENGATLKYAPAVKTNQYFEIASLGFDKTEEIAETPVVTEPVVTTEATVTTEVAVDTTVEVVDTTAAVADTTAAVVDTTAASDESTPVTGDASVMIAVVAAAVISVAAVVVLKKKEN